MDNWIEETDLKHMNEVEKAIIESTEKVEKFAQGNKDKLA